MLETPSAARNRRNRRRVIIELYSASCPDNPNLPGSREGSLSPRCLNACDVSTPPRTARWSAPSITEARRMRAAEHDRGSAAREQLTQALWDQSKKLRRF